MQRMIINLFVVALVVVGIYSISRLYFKITDGFAISNITSDFAYNPEWEVRPASYIENREVEKAIHQNFRYLGKGCQSYVFLSDDGRYVIKFFKYQRYRMQPWLNYLPPLPAIVKYQEERGWKKAKILDGVLKSWKIAFENLHPQSGLIFVHLNKTEHQLMPINIYDKLGLKHEIDLDQYEFCIQRKADLLSAALLQYKANRDLEGGKRVISQLLSITMQEFANGFGDDDLALMQNTGVVDGKPIHLDVGRFMQDEKFKDPEFQKQELFTKTYKLRIWLQNEYPELGAFLDHELQDIIGPSYENMKPQYRENPLRK